MASSLQEPRGRAVPRLAAAFGSIAPTRKVMLDTVRAFGSDAMRLAHRCLKSIRTARASSSTSIIWNRSAEVAVGCDGIHSALRRQLI
jgi:2-polyprenyl-6-methoxyphenol hydroxylase-like FAD-dependent oxidoreductase